MKQTKPCSGCPYKLGLVEAVVNPCPQCRLNGYNMFEKFIVMPSGKSADNLMQNKNESK